MGRALLCLAVSGLFFFADAEAVLADDCGCGSSPFAIERGVSQGGRTRYRTGCRGRSWGASPFAITRGVAQGGRTRFRSGCGCNGSWAGFGRRVSYGTPWWMIRQNLSYSRAAIRYVYVRNYFFRRYPYLFAEGTPADGEAITVDHYLHPQYDVAANPLTRRQQLHLGAWRTWLGDYDGGREAFDAVLAEDAEHPEARWGVAICAVMDRRWSDAATALARVAELDELRIDDEFLPGVAFGEDDALERVMTDLRVATRYGFGDSDAHLVAAWLHLTRGNRTLARVHLKKAKLGAPDNAAVVSLSAQLGEETGTKPAPALAVARDSTDRRTDVRPPVDSDAEVAREPVLVASSATAR